MKQVVRVQREDDARIELLHQLLHAQVVDPHIEHARARPGSGGRLGYRGGGLHGVVFHGGGAGR